MRAGDGPGDGPVDAAGTLGRPATVELCEYYGHDTVYLVRPDEGGVPLRARAGSVPRFARGDRVAVRYQGPPAVAYGRPAAEDATPVGAVDDGSAGDGDEVGGEPTSGGRTGGDRTGGGRTDGGRTGGSPVEPHPAR